MRTIAVPTDGLDADDTRAVAAALDYVAASQKRRTLQAFLLAAADAFDRSDADGPSSSLALSTIGLSEMDLIRLALSLRLIATAEARPAAAACLHAIAVELAGEHTRRHDDLDALEAAVGDPMGGWGPGGVDRWGPGGIDLWAGE